MSTPLIRHFDEAFLRRPNTVLPIRRSESQHIQLAVVEKGVLAAMPSILDSAPLLAWQDLRSVAPGRAGCPRACRPGQG